MADVRCLRHSFDQWGFCSQCGVDKFPMRCESGQHPAPKLAPQADAVGHMNNRVTGFTGRMFLCARCVDLIAGNRYVTFTPEPKRVDSR